jgi:hypothetical protein
VGIDYAACFADVIDWEDVEKLVPEAASGFLAVLDATRGKLDRDVVLAALVESQNCDLPDLPTELQQCLLDAMSPDDTEADNRSLELAQQLVAALSGLQAAFTAATTREGAGLSLYVGYHDSQNRGCRGDDLDGVYWCVEGAYVLSPTGRAYEHVFERKFFTQWG